MPTLGIAEEKSDKDSEDFSTIYSAYAELDIDTA